MPQARQHTPLRLMLSRIISEHPMSTVKDKASFGCSGWAEFLYSAVNMSFENR